MVRDTSAALLRFDGEYIPFPPFVLAKEAIEENLTLFRETGLARHLLVLGESGSGKSSLCRWIGEQHPRRILPDRDVVEALIVSVPPMGTIVGIAEKMLEALGDPARQSGTVTQRTARIVTLCRECRVEQILFDEAQHVYDRGRNRSHYLMADWFKHLIDEINVPTTLLGLPSLEMLLQSNEQLRRRFSRRIPLVLGQSDTESIETECLQLFISLASCMEVGVSSDPYGWREMGIRIYYACDGRVGYVKKILAAALRICLETGAEQIQAAMLEQAFRDEIWWDGVGALNPFNNGFKFRRLDRGGEPFQKAQFSRAEVAS